MRGVAKWHQIYQSTTHLVRALCAAAIWEANLAAHILGLESIVTWCNEAAAEVSQPGVVLAGHAFMINAWAHTKQVRQHASRAG